MLCYIPEATGIWQWRIARKLHFQRPVPLGCQIWRGLSTAGISLIRRLRDFHRPTTRCLIVIGTWSRIKGQSLPGVLHIKRNNIIQNTFVHSSPKESWSSIRFHHALPQLSVLLRRCWQSDSQQDGCSAEWCHAWLLLLVAPFRSWEFNDIVPDYPEESLANPCVYIYNYIYIIWYDIHTYIYIYVYTQIIYCDYIWRINKCR